VSLDTDHISGPKFAESFTPLLIAN